MGLPFLTNRAKQRDQVIAVDLGGRVTKAVYVRRQADKLSLASYSLVETPNSDQAISAQALAEHLKSVVRSLNARSRQLALAVGVTDTVFRQVEVPLMPVDQVRQMLKYNSKTYLNQELPDHVFDCSFLPVRQTKSSESSKSAGPPKQPLAVAAAKRQLVDDWHAAIKGAGLMPEMVVPGLVGPVNALELAEPELFAKETVALVDLGFKNSTIVILDCGDLVLNRVVNIGGDHLTQGLADALGITYTEAEQIKIGMPTEVQETLAGLLHPLGRELRASIDFFEHQHDKTVSQALLSGGSARSEFVVQSLQNELMIPCRTWNPAQTLHLALGPAQLGDLEQTAPQLTVAIGTAASAL
jgi:type IV pilus assembly protein PilM